MYTSEVLCWGKFAPNFQVLQDDRSLSAACGSKKHHVNHNAALRFWKKFMKIIHVQFMHTRLSTYMSF